VGDCPLQIAALEIEKLASIRGHRVLFHDLSLELEAGALLTLEGPNGSGKTTLLRLIAGLLRPSAGTIRVRTAAAVRTAVAVFAEAEERGRFVGWLGHQDGVKPQLTVREQMDFWAALYGAAPGEAFAAFGLAALAEVPGQFLSAGQKRRLALARLVLCGRPLWLLDEPYAALDGAGKALAADRIAAHCHAGGIALAATHEPLGLPCRTLRLGGVS
jgi:heme exporter protein A